MKRFALVIFALGALCLPSRGISDDPSYTPSPLEILDADRKALTSLSIVVEIQTPKSGNRWSRFPMFFDYVAPNKYRSEIRTGGLEGSLIIIADGRMISSYPTKTGVVTQNLQADVVASIKSNGPSDLLTVLATPSLTFSSLFHLVSSTAQDSRVLLTVRPKVSVASYDKIMLVLSADGKTPISAEAVKAGKTIVRLTFKTYARNAAVDPAKLIFTPPDK